MPLPIASQSILLRVCRFAILFLKVTDWRPKSLAFKNQKLSQIERSK
jgi:hypothetical protein